MGLMTADGSIERRLREFPEGLSVNEYFISTRRAQRIGRYGVEDGGLGYGHRLVDVAPDQSPEVDGGTPPRASISARSSRVAT
jgi:hypothetical protein